jgi:hypothetical protein
MKRLVLLALLAIVVGLNVGVAAASRPGPSPDSARKERRLISDEGLSRRVSELVRPNRTDIRRAKL